VSAKQKRLNELYHIYCRTFKGRVYDLVLNTMHWLKMKTIKKFVSHTNLYYAEYFTSLGTAETVLDS